jgi:hypothetical protein
MAHWQDDDSNDGVRNFVGAIPFNGVTTCAYRRCHRDTRAAAVEVRPLSVGSGVEVRAVLSGMP